VKAAGSGLAGYLARTFEKAATKKSTPTMNIPTRAALFLLNLLHATAHWLALRLLFAGF
jgi:hypothetical protein